MIFFSNFQIFSFSENFRNFYLSTGKWLQTIIITIRKIKRNFLNFQNQLWRQNTVQTSFPYNLSKYYHSLSLYHYLPRSALPLKKLSFMKNRTERRAFWGGEPLKTYKTEQKERRSTGSNQWRSVSASLWRQHSLAPRNTVISRHSLYTLLCCLCPFVLNFRQRTYNYQW